MKINIMLTLCFVLFSITAISQNLLEAKMSYDTTNSTLSIEIVNNTNDEILISQQSKYDIITGSFLQIITQDREEKHYSAFLPLGNELTNELWDTFSMLSPRTSRKIVYQASIKKYGGTLTSAEIIIIYRIKDSRGEYQRFRLHNKLFNEDHGQETF